MPRRLILLAVTVSLFGAACTRGGPEMAEIERLNAEPGKLGRFTFAYYTAIAALPDGGALAVWMKDLTPFRPLVYRRAATGQAPFDAETYLSPETLRETISIVPSVAYGASETELYAIWQVRRPTSGLKFIAFRRSEDGGATWGDDATVNSEPTAFIPAIASDGEGGIYTAWTDERRAGVRVFFNRSVDHGRTWLPADRRIDAAEGELKGTALNVSIAADARGRIVVTWADQTQDGRHIRAVASDDRGETWTPAARLDDGEGRLSPSEPSVVFAGDQAVVVWNATTTGVSAKVVSDTSSDGGRTWGEDVLLQDTVKGILPRVHLISDGRRAHAVFHAGPLRESWHVYHAETDERGQWRAHGDGLRRISVGEGKFANPRIAHDRAGGLYVTYEDDGKRAFLSRSADGGATWSAEPTVVYEVDPAGEKVRVRYPQIAASDGVAYVMWELWSDPAAIIKNLSDAGKKVAPADLFVRRVTFRP